MTMREKEKEKEKEIEWNSCVCNGISMLFFSSLTGYLMLRIRRCLLLWYVCARSLRGQVPVIGWAENPILTYTYLIHDDSHSAWPAVHWKRLYFFYFLFLMIDRPLVRYNITLPTCILYIYMYIIRYTCILYVHKHVSI